MLPADSKLVSSNDTVSSVTVTSYSSTVEGKKAPASINPRLSTATRKSKPVKNATTSVNNKLTPKERAKSLTSAGPDSKSSSSAGAKSSSSSSANQEITFESSDSANEYGTGIEENEERSEESSSATSDSSSDSSPIIKDRHRISIPQPRQRPSAIVVESQQKSSAGRKRKQLIDPEEENCDDTSNLTTVGLKKVIAFLIHSITMQNLCKTYAKPMQNRCKTYVIKMYRKKDRTR